MAKFTARVEFIVLEFDAKDYDDANDQINGLLDELGDVDTTLRWDDVEWTLREES